MLVQIESFAIGSRIRITDGPLEDLTGVVSMISDDGLKCYLKMDSFSDGVYVTCGTDILTMDHVASDPWERQVLQVS